MGTLSQRMAHLWNGTVGKRSGWAHHCVKRELDLDANAVDLVCTLMFAEEF